VGTRTYAISAVRKQVHKSNPLGAGSQISAAHCLTATTTHQHLLDLRTHHIASSCVFYRSYLPVCASLERWYSVRDTDYRPADSNEPYKLRCTFSIFDVISTIYIYIYIRMLYLLVEVLRPCQLTLKWTWSGCLDVSAGITLETSDNRYVFTDW